MAYHLNDDVGKVMGLCLLTVWLWQRPATGIIHPGFSDLL